MGLKQAVTREQPVEQQQQGVAGDQGDGKTFLQVRKERQRLEYELGQR